MICLINSKACISPYEKLGRQLIYSVTKVDTELMFLGSTKINHNLTERNLNALVMTDMELQLMAAAAMIGDNNKPKKGYRIPAAIGTPAEL